MALTGVPLLVLAALAGVTALGLTIRYWSRGGRWRPVTRTVGVLAVEALLLFTAGLVVNRALDDLFPSWTALLHQDSAPPAAPGAGPATRLDGWLRDQTARDSHARDSHGGLSFDWTPPGERYWAVSRPPTVYVPAAYFTQTAARFPVVVLVAADDAGSVPAAATPAVVVSLRAQRVDVEFLTRTLPEALAADLRVGPRGWGVVAIGAEATAGLDALAKDSARYWSAVAVADATGRLPDTVRTPRGLSGGQAVLTVTAESGPVPDRLAKALRWVYAHLPAPLAAPLAPGPTAPPAPVPASSR